jgi:glycosyltransferase involved in cell wall biosynthesis
MNKPTLCFYTNMPTPYQLDFFDELAILFSLQVVYFTSKEKDRQWNLPTNNENYTAIVLKNNFIARGIQKKITSFHFSFGITGYLMKDASSYIIVNGTYWSPNVVLAILISKWRGKKVFFYGEPLFVTNNGFKKMLKKILLWPVKYGTDGLLAIGKWAMQSYAGYGYKKKMYNIPYNINTGAFNREQLDKDRLNDLLGTYKTAGETVFLTSAALIKRKGIDIVIKAFLAVPAIYNVQLLIIGDGPERAELQELSAGDNRIHFTGFCEKEQVPYYFAIADVFAFASRYDGWALVINEAVAAGLAIVCSDTVGAAADKLVDGYNALICPAGNIIDCFTHAFITMTAYPEKRANLISNMANIKMELSSAYNAKKIYELCTVAE